MPDYKRMYYLLFNETSRAIEQLQEAQRQAEEFYLTSDDSLLLLKNERCYSNEKKTKREPSLQKQKGLHFVYKQRMK